MAIHRCRICNRIFLPVKSHQVYCEACRKKGIKYYTNTEATYRRCPICEKDFISHIKSHVYCSAECRAKADKRKKKEVKKICAFCGKTFYSGNSKKKYCSANCYEKNRRQK